jgi:hypothetical protein
MAKKKTLKTKKVPAEQGKSEVGYKKPPKEHQFKPGQSGKAFEGRAIDKAAIKALVQTHKTEKK